MYEEFVSELSLPPSGQRSKLTGYVSADDRSLAMTTRSPQQDLAPLLPAHTRFPYHTYSHKVSKLWVRNQTSTENQQNYMLNTVVPFPTPIR